MKKKLVMTISAVLLTAFLAGGTVSAASVNAGGKSGSAIAGLLTDYARRKYEEQKKAEEERQARVNEMKRMVPVLLTEIKRDRDLKTYEEYYEKYKETFDKLISYGEEAIPLLEKSGGERGLFRGLITKFVINKIKPGYFASEAESPDEVYTAKAEPEFFDIENDINLGKNGLTLKIYDNESGKVVKTYSGDFKNVNLEWSPDGRYLVMAITNGEYFANVIMFDSYKRFSTIYSQYSVLYDEIREKLGITHDYCSLILKPAEWLEDGALRLDLKLITWRPYVAEYNATVDFYPEIEELSEVTIIEPEE